VTSQTTSGGHFNHTVTCPGSKKVLGGGCNQQSGANRGLVDSHPNGDNGWRCHVRDISNAQTVTLTVYAICATVN
jgi:hypothetical protein